MKYLDAYIAQQKERSPQFKASERLERKLRKRNLWTGSDYGRRKAFVRYSSSNWIPNQTIEVLRDGSLRRV